MTVTQHATDAGQDGWQVHRAFVNDPDLADAAQSFATQNLTLAFASRRDRERVIGDARDVVRALFVNATQRQSPLVELGLMVDGDALRIDVENHRRGCPTCEPVPFTEPTDTTVEAITALTARWDCEPTDEGTHVWAEIDLT
jgi:hypothetical protein